MMTELIRAINSNTKKSPPANHKFLKRVYQDLNKYQLNVPAAASEPATTQSTKPTSGAKLSYKEKQELGELEKRIETGEARKVEIEAQLSSNSADFDAITALSEEFTKLTESLERDVERWAELAERA